MADETKEGIAAAPAATVKNFDFDAFLAEIGKENPDISVIKEGIERFGTGKLSDSQKESFLQRIFPSSENAQKLGFENISGIKNTLTAVKDLQASGALTAAQVDDIMSIKYPPENGKNMAMAVALNIRGAEFKLEKFTKPEDIALVKHNLQTYGDTLALMEKISPNALDKALKESYQPKNMNRALSVNDLALKSETLKGFLQDHSSYRAALPENGLKVDGQNITEIGGNNGLTINGAPRPALKVNAGPKEEDEENIANMNPNTGNDAKKRRSFDFEKVREQDIIQYMFENWFLEGVSAALKAPFWIADKMIDAFENKHGTNMPRTSVKPQNANANNPQVSPSLNEAGQNVARACIDSLEQQKDYYAKLGDTILNNTNPPKNPQDWKVAVFNNKPILDTQNPLDIKKIQEFNKMAQTDPDFKTKLNAFKNFAKEDFNIVKKYVRLGATTAAAIYASEHLNEPLEKLSQSKLMKAAMENTQKLMERISEISARVEYNYKLENKLALDAKLTPEQKAEVDKKALPLLNTFAENFKTAGADLSNFVNDYHQKTDAVEKSDTARKVQAALNTLNNAMSQEYLDKICPTSRPKEQNGAPIDLYLLAEQEITGSELQKQWTTVMQNKSGQLDAFMKDNQKRKQAFNNSPLVKNVKKVISVTKTTSHNVVNSFKSIFTSAKQKTM